MEPGRIILTLTRFAYTPIGTFGRLVLPDGWQCYTVERPWLGNAPNVSCIPEGTFPLAMRRSGVVERSSGGEFLEGWEVSNVPGRSFIMIHPANTMDDLEGCIGPGDALGAVNGKWAVLNSRATFRELMRRLAPRRDWVLSIVPYRAEEVVAYDA